MNVDQALAEIGVIEGQVYVMGANDSEMGDIEQIRLKMRNEEITPEMAVTLAQRVLDSKQDYH